MTVSHLCASLLPLMQSVGKAALAMVEEVRHQFNTIAGLMEGTARPDYKRCVEISTKVLHIIAQHVPLILRTDIFMPSNARAGQVSPHCLCACFLPSNPLSNKVAHETLHPNIGNCLNRRTK